MSKQFSYNPLWKLLIDKSLKKADLRRDLKLSSTILSNMSKNKPVSMTTLLKISEYLDCYLNNIVEIVDKQE